MLDEKGGMNMTKLEQLIEKIEADPQNAEYTKEGIAPLFSAPRKAKILIVGQAPGISLTNMVKPCLY